MSTAASNRRPKLWLINSGKCIAPRTNILSVAVIVAAGVAVSVSRPQRLRQPPQRHTPNLGAGQGLEGMATSDVLERFQFHTVGPHLA